MKKLIAGNWKMNLTAAESLSLAKQLSEVKLPNNLEVAVLPSFAALSFVQTMLGPESDIKLGAQDCFWEAKGAYTGEVSPVQLKELGCQYVLIGHSERRLNLGETDEMVNRKIAAAQKAGLVPVLCVGETDEDRRLGRWASKLNSQVVNGLKGIEVVGTHEIIIAYEPIWAIGTGRPCEPKVASEAHALIKNALLEVFSASRAKNHFRIIYGGSVDGSNIATYLAEDGIDGALVGGASQKFLSFSALLEATANIAGKQGK